MATINSGNSTTLYSTTQTTTSVSTATNLPAPQVNETNFTTLYSNSSAAATGGGTSGNLLVSGNLRVLGTSDLEGAVTIGNSYILPTSDGTNGQVVVTDGAGNLTFQSVSSISSYAIQADTATGGANLTLVGLSTTDSVKFAEGTNIGIVRTDANTITISTVADNIPDGTAKGQVLYWNGSAWTANSTITSAADADRLRLVYENSDPGVNSAVFLRKDYKATPYTTNDGVSIGFQLDSDSQATNQIALIAADWDPTNPTISLNTNINNNTTGPFVNVGQFAANKAILPGDLEVNGGDITTTQTTASVFNTTATTVNAFGAATTLNIGAPFPGITTIGGDAVVNGDITMLADLMYLNFDKTDLDVIVYFGRVAPNNDAAIKWNKTTNSFEWSKDSTTWYDFIDANLTAPFYNGQLLSYLNGEWINENRVTTTDVNERNVFEYRPLSPAAGPNSALFIRKDYSNAAPGTPGVGTYADGAGVGLTFQVDSDTQTPPGGSVGEANNYANITGVYSSTVPTVSLRTSIDNGTTFTQVANFSTSAATIGGTTLTLDANNAGAANNSSIIANRGSSGTDASLTWTESTGFWVFNEDVFSSGEIIGNTAIGTNGQYVTFNNEDITPIGDCYLLVKRATDPDVNIKWNESTDRWQNTFDGTTYYNLPNQNLDTTSDVTFASVTIDGGTTVIDTTTTTTTAITAAAVATTANATIRSSKFQIQITDNVTGNIHVLEAMMFFQGTTAYLTTYAEMYNSTSLATFTADVNSGNTRLLATPASTNSTTFKVTRISTAL